jgi:hypothetical protein
MNTIEKIELKHKLRDSLKLLNFSKNLSNLFSEINKTPDFNSFENDAQKKISAAVNELIKVQKPKEKVAKSTSPDQNN